MRCYPEFGFLSSRGGLWIGRVNHILQMTHYRWN